MTDRRQHYHICERCNRRCEERVYYRPADEYWCPTCLDNAAEAAYERQCEDFHDGGSTSWPDAEAKRMEEARKLK